MTYAIMRGPSPPTWRLRPIVFTATSRETRLVWPLEYSPSLVLQDERHNLDPRDAIARLPALSSSRLDSLRPCQKCNRLISSAFQLLLRMLFNFPSRYSYAIGLKTYLELEVIGPRLQTQYPMRPTHKLGNFPSGVCLRGYHALWRVVPDDLDLTFGK